MISVWPRLGSTGLSALCGFWERIIFPEKVVCEWFMFKSHPAHPPQTLHTPVGIMIHQSSWFTCKNVRFKLDLNLHNEN